MRGTLRMESSTRAHYLKDSAVCVLEDLVVNNIRDPLSKWMLVLWHPKGCWERRQQGEG